MNELYNLSIKELIESIDENISDTKETRKKLVICLNQEKDARRKVIKKAVIGKCDEDIFRFEMQKVGIEEIVKEHAVYGYKKRGIKPNEKTAQEGQVQEQQITLELDRITCKLQSKNSYSIVEQKSYAIKVELH